MPSAWPEWVLVPETCLKRVTVDSSETAWVLAVFSKLHTSLSRKLLPYARVKPEHLWRLCSAAMPDAGEAVDARTVVAPCSDIVYCACIVVQTPKLSQLHAIDLRSRDPCLPSTFVRTVIGRSRL